MPMDIRTFFSKAPAKKTAKKPKSSSPTPAAAAAAATATTTKKKAVEKTKSIPEEKSKSRYFEEDKKEKKKEKETVAFDDSSTEDTDIEESTAKRNKNNRKKEESTGNKKKRNPVILDDSSDTDDERNSTRQKKPTVSVARKKGTEDGDMPENRKETQAMKRKAPPPNNNDDEAIEMLPEDFFARSKKKKVTTATSTKPKKVEKEKHAVEINDNDDDDDYRPTPSSSSPRRSSPRKSAVAANRKRIREADDSDDDLDFVDQDNEPDEDEDEDLDDDIVMDDEEDLAPTKHKKKSLSPQKTKSSSTPSPAKRTKKTTPSPKKKKIVLLEPNTERDVFDLDSVQVPEILEGLTFVFTGILDDLNRDDAIDLVKSLGARVTTSVSGKTSYLVVGPELEDGRPYHEGKKYKTAMEKSVKIVMGKNKLYGLCHDYHERVKKERGIVTTETDSSSPTKQAEEAATTTTAAGKPLPSNPYAKVAAAPAISNPYAKKPISNPYAKAATSNPYAKKANPYAKTADKSSSSDTNMDTKPAAANSNRSNQLWVDRHAPKETRGILGNKEHINKLSQWLSAWERNFNNPKAYGKTFSNPKGPWKAALLSGPPGIGKTTTATLVAKEAGRDLLEFNASDARSKKALQTTLGDITGSQTLHFGDGSSNSSSKKKKSKQKLRCIIMDEVDGMGAGDRSGMAELIQMIKKSKVPIICICNDRQSQKLKSLAPYCLDLKFRRPTKSVMATRACRIAKEEGFEVERNAAEAIAESCGNDVRQVINCLQMWAQKTGSSSALTYRNLKDRQDAIKKDEILRVSLFDAAKTILEGRKNLANADSKAEVDSLMKRSDAFFVDYSFTGLLVQQNYPRVMQHQYSTAKRANDPAQELEFLTRMHHAAASMSDYAVVEHNIRSGDLNWSLLPASGMLAVQTGYYAGGESGAMMPGFPEFTAWLGKNSSKGKKMRLLSEIHHHMNYKVSGNSQDIRESYLPVLRERIMGNMLSGDEGSTKDTIALMDDYGLSREDVMEKLDEFRMVGSSNDKKSSSSTNPNSKIESTSFADLDSKQKASFTREYNQGAHKSQALVAEQGGGKTKKSKSKRERDPADLDAIDEDGDEESDDDNDVDDEAELKKLQDKFKKKGRKGKGAGGATKGKGRAKKAKN